MEVMTSLTDFRKNVMESYKNTDGISMSLCQARHTRKLYGMFPSPSPLVSVCYLEEPGKEGVQLVCEGLEGLRDLPEPALCEGCESQDAGLQVHHPTARYRGWGGHC